MKKQTLFLTFPLSNHADRVGPRWMAYAVWEKWTVVMRCERAEELKLDSLSITESHRTSLSFLKWSHCEVAPVLDLLYLQVGQVV